MNLVLEQIVTKNLKRLELPNQVELYFGNISLSHDLRRHLEKILSDEERARAYRFVHKEDQHRYIVCRALLRIILAQFVHRLPEELSFQLGKYEKPYLDQVGAPEFNLSHSHKHVCIAVHPSLPVGVDIEYKRKDLNFQELVSYVFTERERNFFQQIDDALKLEAFYQGWTRKEAFVKATGEGLHRSLHSFEVLSHCAYNHEQDFRNEKIIVPPWWIYTLDLHPDYTAAVCIKSNENDSLG